MTHVPGSPRPEVLAHRGFAPDGAENTLQAFRAAAELGCRWVETDVRTTADGVVLALHDPTVDRVSDGTGSAGQMTFAQVRALRLPGGAQVPALSEVLEQLPELHLNVDVKDAASATALPRLLAQTGTAGRVRIASFCDDRRSAALRELRRLGAAPHSSSAGLPCAAAALITLAVLPPAWPAVRALLARRWEPFTALQVPLRLGWALPRLRRLPLLGARLAEVVVPARWLVGRAQRAGLQVHVWTVNTPEDLRLVLDAGADALVTDRADLALEAVRGRG